MKKIRYIVLTLLTVLLSCLTTGCGKDELDEYTLSITGTWGLLEVSGYYFLYDNPINVNIAFDPYNPGKRSYENTTEDGCYRIEFPSIKCVITQPSKKKYHLILYTYDDDTQEWDLNVEGDSNDGKNFSFPEDYNGSLRILTGYGQIMNAAFIDKSSMFYRYSFKKLN